MNHPIEQTYQPTQLDQLLYSISATARILQMTINDIDTITPCNGGCQVFLKYKLWTILIPQSEYIQQFVTERKARSSSLLATQHIDNACQWTVWNESNNSRYLVTVSQDFVHCACSDWQIQFEAFGHQRVCCKHGYAVLEQLGFSTLKDYLKAWQPEDRLHRLQTTFHQKRQATV